MTIDIKFKAKFLYTISDKLKWFGDGIWLFEPDELEFTYKDYDCKIIRIIACEGLNKDHVYGGHLCGYVKIPLNHKYHKKSDYDEMKIDCHGGLTFGKWDRWDWVGQDHWIGFDCAHYTDLKPYTNLFEKNLGINEIFPLPKELKDNPSISPTYKDMEFCIKECKNIVEQLREMNG